MKKLLYKRWFVYGFVSNKGGKAISSFKEEINKEFVKYNSYISSFKNSLENIV